MSDLGPRLDCPVTAALTSVADRQSLLVVREVLLGQTRFTGILSRTGLSRDVLSDRLDRLVEVGVLERVPTGGRRTEYACTPSGEALLPVLLALGCWAMDHLDVPEGVDGWAPALLQLPGAQDAVAAGRVRAAG